MSTIDSKIPTADAARNALSSLLKRQAAEWARDALLRGRFDPLARGDARKTAAWLAEQHVADPVRAEDLLAVADGTYKAPAPAELDGAPADASPDAVLDRAIAEEQAAAAKKGETITFAQAMRRAKARAPGAAQALGYHGGRPRR